MKTYPLMTTETLMIDPARATRLQEIQDGVKFLRGQTFEPYRVQSLVWQVCEELEFLLAEVAALGVRTQQMEVETIHGVVVHWFLQGGKAQFGELSTNGRDPQNDDEVIAAILERVRTHLDAAEARVRALEQELQNEKEKTLARVVRQPDPDVALPQPPTG